MHKTMNGDEGSNGRAAAQGRARVPALLCLGGALLAALAGCGGGGGDDDADRGSLSGTRWRVQAIGSGGQLSDCPTAAFDQEGSFFVCGGDDRYDFGSDGSLVIDFVDDFSTFGGGRGQYRGRWSQSGQTVTATITQFGFDADDSGVVDAGELQSVDPPEIETAQIQTNSDQQVVLIREGDERYVLNKF